MPLPADQAVNSPSHYTMAGLVDLRRQILRDARSFPVGAERNQQRQIAISLRRLLKSTAWLSAHVTEARSP